MIALLFVSANAFGCIWALQRRKFNFIWNQTEHLILKSLIYMGNSNAIHSKKQTTNKQIKYPPKQRKSICEKLSLRFIWLQLVENKLNESAVRIDFVNFIQYNRYRHVTVNWIGVLKLDWHCHVSHLNVSFFVCNAKFENRFKIILRFI